MEKTTYKALRKRVDDFVHDMAKSGKVAVTPGYFTSLRVNGVHKELDYKELHKAWPNIVNDLGLIRDGLGSWTLPGLGYTQDEIERTVTKAITIMQGGSI